MTTTVIPCLLLTAVLGFGQSATKPPATGKPAVTRSKAAQKAEFDRLMREGETAREQNRVQDAAALYRKAVRLNSSSAEAWWYLGMCCYELDLYPEGESAFGHLTRLDPKDPAGWAMRGLCEFRNGRFQESLDNLVKSKALNLPKDTEMDMVVRYHLVMLLNRAGQHELAGSLLAEFPHVRLETPSMIEVAGINALRLKLLPSEVPADRREPVELAGRAAVRVWQIRVADAKEAARQLLARHPDLPNVHYVMGYVLLRDNASDEALAEFRKELDVSPDHVQARLQIANEHIQRAEPAKGLPYAEEAVRISPGDFTARLIFGRVLLALDRVDDSVRELETAVKMAPSSPDAHLALASAYTKVGKLEEAEKHRKIVKDLKQAQARTSW